ncbi:GDP-mannose 4,6-dehydratase [Zavarzinella formosa]|uniref:GDP-mannose 4,6-dehydratase n=1 Tax=Zavarzinella formosa TaxID=360055 RepID=UPI0002ED83D7|nr:GDP-mannose 4,6-dehydratase [Zavarzinella formosa]
MRCLITGATGFVGGHLAARLREAGHEVIGLARETRPVARRASLGESVPLHAIDLRDTAGLSTIIQQIQPGWIFHLAGYANTGKSFREPKAAWDGNLTATQSLYEAMTVVGCSARVLYVSTGLVYGDSTPDFPFCTENQPLRPASPYAASKAAADLLSYQATRHPGLDVVIVRPFNHIGPGQATDYAASNFARQLAAIEAGQHLPTILTGGLDSQRDFTDVRDMVRAYVLLMEKGATGEAYNAGSGGTFVMRDILERLRRMTTASVQVNEQTDPNRKNDTAISRVDNGKLTRVTGWQPAIDINQTLVDLLADWRERIAQTPAR